MSISKLIVLDETNCKFTDLDPVTRKKLVKEVTYFVPYAPHIPSYKAGRWDGTVSLCTMGGSSYVNLLDRLLPIVIDAGYQVEIEDLRIKYDFQFQDIDKDFFSHIKWPAGHRKEGEPIELAEHQVALVNTFTKNLQSIQQAATSAGKTIVCAALSKQIEAYGRSIIIVPNKSLVEQTEADYKLVGLDVGVYFGDRKEYNRHHTICTWQSLNILDKKGKDADEEFLKDFIEDVVCVIVDESHVAKADILKDLLTKKFNNIPIRWGLTGTVPKEDHQFAVILSCIGPVVNQVTAKELQDKNVLSNCQIQVLQTQETKDFKQYHDEKEFLSTDQERLAWLSKLIGQVSESGNTLVLVDRIETGKMLEESIPGCVFLRGETKLKERKEQYAEVNTSEGKIIVATFGIAAVGISIDRIFNLVLVDAGKSFIRTIQSIGRGLRRAKDKDFVQIYDICSSLKYSKRHLTERKRHYKEAQYPFTVEKINYRVGL